MITYIMEKNEKPYFIAKRSIQDHQELKMREGGLVSQEEYNAQT